MRCESGRGKQFDEQDLLRSSPVNLVAWVLSPPRLRPPVSYAVPPTLRSFDIRSTLLTNAL
jgi:hypothetical protein